MSTLVKMASMGLSSERVVQELFSWGEGGKQFTVKAADKLSKEWTGEESWVGWRKIWKLGVQQWFRVFVWLMTHGRLVTNVERRRRHIGASTVCGGCQEGRRQSFTR